MAVVPDQRKPWLRRRLEDMRFTQWGKALFVVFLGATALFGGLDDVDTGVTPLTPGQDFDDGAATVTVERASLVPKLTAGSKVLLTAEPGSQFLGVMARLTNDATVDVPLKDELDLRLPDARPVGVFRLDDGSQTSRLGPGLTDNLAFVWQVPLSGPQPGDAVTVRIWKKTYQELNVTFGKAWLDSLTDYGEVDVPLKARP